MVNCNEYYKFIDSWASRILDHNRSGVQTLYETFRMEFMDMFGSDLWEDPRCGYAHMASEEWFDSMKESGSVLCDAESARAEYESEERIRLESHE